MTITRGALGRALSGLAIATLLASTASAGLMRAQVASPEAATAKADQARAALLAAKLRAECERYYKTSAAEDIEAAYTFVISQTSPSLDVVKQAIALLLKTKKLAPVCAAAAGNLRNAYANRGGGTGAIASNGSSFSAPTVSLGGGSSNYGS